MRDEFSFDAIRSTEFCVNLKGHHEQTNYLVPTDHTVQTALGGMLVSTVQQLESGADEAVWHEFEFSEKYAPKEALITDIRSDAMVTISALYDEEGWPHHAKALHDLAHISYYFAVFRDDQHRKLVAVRRATQFKGVVSSRLMRFIDDSLTMLGDQVFKLDNEFDFFATRDHVYILYPAGFERVAEIERFVAEKAREKALALGEEVAFADFATIAEFVARHKRAARFVSALASRGGLNQIDRRKLIAAARQTGVDLVNIGRKISPAKGSEMAFLELLDRRRYTVTIQTGPREAFLAGSRKQLRPPA
jgi:hypothetical protein